MTAAADVEALVERLRFFFNARYNGRERKFHEFMPDGKNENSGLFLVGVLSDAIATLLHIAEENRRLLGDLRSLAIKQHVRQAVGGSFVPNGGSCELCHSEWGNEEPETHGSKCGLAAKETK